jgi:hypothetical protein
VRGVGSEQRGVMVGEFVGDPAAARHGSSVKQLAGAFKRD